MSYWKDVPKVYKSRFQELKEVVLPEFSGTRVLMLPFLMEDMATLPDDLAHYKDTVEELVSISPKQQGVAYLTIDEKFVKEGETLRQKGLHVDGLGAEGRPDLSIWATTGLIGFLSYYWDDAKKRWYQNAAGIGGMITVSSPAGCRAWNKDFSGRINRNGDCEHLREQCFPESESVVLEANIAYWCNSTCVHESLPVKVDTKRTFVRLSMPSDAPWFAGYTRNPKGIEPTGVVVSNGRSS